MCKVAPAKAVCFELPQLFGLVQFDEGMSGYLLGWSQQDHAQGDELMDFGDNLSDEEHDLGYGVPAGSLADLHTRNALN